MTEIIEVKTGGINFWDFVESLEKKSGCKINFTLANLGEETNKLDLFVCGGETIGNKIIAAHIEKLMLKADLKKIGDGDFCGEESRGCMEFEDRDGSSHIVLFTNDTKGSGRIFISHVRYPKI